MTRNRDLDTPYLSADCDHSPAVPVVEGNEIIGWICHCGRERKSVRDLVRADWTCYAGTGYCPGTKNSKRKNRATGAWVCGFCGQPVPVKEAKP